MSVFYIYCDYTCVRISLVISNSDDRILLIYVYYWNILNVWDFYHIRRAEICCRREFYEQTLGMILKGNLFVKGWIILDLFGNSAILCQRSLDYLWEKQQVTANNIANNDTPGFKAQYVTFEDELKSRLEAARGKSKNHIGRAISGTQISLHDTKDEMRMDGSNVDMVAENAELAKSTLQYQFTLKAFNDDYLRLRSVIKGQ